MLQDIEAPRPTEIDALNGYIADRALGLNAPMNALFAGLVKMKEQDLR
jgi:ketopantoate reductase